MLKDFLEDYNIEKVLKIEEKEDRQFLSLAKAQKNMDDKVIFIFLVIQNALISYQLSGTGENRWDEFSLYIVANQDSLEKENLLSWWQNFLNQCKGNRRLVNMKLKRIEKSLSLLDSFQNLDDIKKYYNNMKQLNSLLANSLNQKENAKTIVFAIKMYGYVAREFLGFFVLYPMDISIPVDSRISKIYELETGRKKYTSKQVENYFTKLSKKYNIPPLHLDSLLWVKYWNILSSD